MRSVVLFLLFFLSVSLGAETIVTYDNTKPKYITKDTFKKSMMYGTNRAVVHTHWGRTYRVYLHFLVPCKINFPHPIKMVINNAKKIVTEKFVSGDSFLVLMMAADYTKNKAQTIHVILDDNGQEKSLTLDLRVIQNHNNANEEITFVEDSPQTELQRLQSSLVSSKQYAERTVHFLKRMMEHPIQRAWVDETVAFNHQKTQITLKNITQVGGFIMCHLIMEGEVYPFSTQDVVFEWQPFREYIFFKDREPLRSEHPSHIYWYEVSKERKDRRSFSVVIPVDESSHHFFFRLKIGAAFSFSYGGQPLRLTTIRDAEMLMYEWM